MKFACPACGIITSSHSSLQAGGYFERYKGKPPGCPSCRTTLDLTCQCGAVGNAQTIQDGLCPDCTARKKAQGNPCANHPDASAVTLCPECNRPLCEDCRPYFGGPCRTCKEEEKKRREEENARAEAERKKRERIDKIRRKIMKQRQENKQCKLCGKPLGFFNRLRRKNSHPTCTRFVK